MRINTRIFGEIEIDESKVVNFSDGIIGFPDLKKFILIHDQDDEKTTIQWLQSIDEPLFAMPVINPLLIVEAYNPEVEDELLSKLGDIGPEDMLVLVTMTIPEDITKMTINLRAPIVINTKSMKSAQIIVEDSQYAVKYPVYDILKGKKEGTVC